MQESDFSSQNVTPPAVGNSPQYESRPDTEQGELVSVVVPVYNGQNYIESTVQSILQQTYTNLELILVNDGSTDDSRTIINRYAQHDSRVKPVHQANGGVAFARNTVIARARGSLVAFCDQDDRWLPDKLEKQLEKFRQDTRVGIVFCAARTIRLNSDNEFVSRYSEKHRGDVFALLVEKNFITCCTAVVRRHILTEVGGFDDDKRLMGADDWHLWLKITTRYLVDYVPEPLCIRVYHGDNYSLKNDEMYVAEILCIEKIEKFARSNNFEADWDAIKASLHRRNAQTYIYSGMFRKGGDAILEAQKLTGGVRLMIRGWALKLLPQFLLRFTQGLKRQLSNS